MPVDITAPAQSCKPLTSEYVGPKLTDGSEKGMSGFALKVAEVAAKHNNKENYRVEITFACRS